MQKRSGRSKRQLGWPRADEETDNIAVRQSLISWNKKAFDGELVMPEAGEKSVNYC